MDDQQPEKTYRRSKAWMLGPKAENADQFEDLFLKAFRDYCHWRRNFHPEDTAYVRASERMSLPFQNFGEEFQDHLFELLSDLKRSVPFFSPRYLGHMNTDLLMPGILGYVAAMLYNQNNVVEESATITMRFEIEAMKLIQEMLHLPENAWGHLCSGGTTANTEALWVARNLRLFPYQIALAIEHAEPSPADDGPNLADKLCALSVGSRDETFGELLDGGKVDVVTIDEAAALRAEVMKVCAQNETWAEQVNEQSLGELGLATFSRRCRGALGSAFPKAFKVIVSKNAHYSLKKSIGLIGLGAANIEKVPLNGHMRMNMDILEERLQECHDEGECVLAVIGVYGSTEEGATDNFGRLTEMREQRKERGEGDFWIHGDACYGGYALAMSHPMRKPMASAVAISEHMESIADAIASSSPLEESDEHASDSEEEPSEKNSLRDDLLDACWGETQAKAWLQRSRALGACDSVSIDPHKLGYIPYPAGAVLYRNHAVREFIECDAPYLNAAEEDPAGTPRNDREEKNIWVRGNLGKYTLEGSRPGAYGAATWLAHKTVPLDRNGHGFIVSQSILGARYLRQTLEREFTDEDGIDCRFIGEDPDLNILCYTFPTRIDGNAVSLAVLNRSIERLYEEMLPTQDNPTQKRDFVVSKTALEYEEYGEILSDEIMSDWCIDGEVKSEGDLSKSGNPWRDDHKLTLLRSVVMGPFLAEATTRPGVQGGSRKLVEQYAEFLSRNLKGTIREVMGEPIKEKPTLEGPVLLLEDDPLYHRTLGERVRKSFEGLKLHDAFEREQAEHRTANENIRAALVDVKLEGEAEGGIDYLRKVAHRDDFEGAVVFTGTDPADGGNRIRKRIDQIGGCRIEYREKPDPNEEKFGTAMNGVLADLWDILHEES